MTNITPLEKDVIEKLLAEKFGASIAFDALEALEIERREFSLDVENNSRCVGFYVHFRSNHLLSKFELPHHLSIHAFHDLLPAGCDFILYFKDGGAIDYLEATFYGDTLLVSEVASTDHRFRLP
jgi:hypothetical protein